MTTMPLRALITAAGSPGSAALIRALQGSPDHPVALSGVDMSQRAIGALMLESFDLVPAAADPSFIDRLTEIAVARDTQVLLPQSSAEIPTVADHRIELERAIGGRVLVDAPDTVRVLEDKSRLNELLRDAGHDFLPRQIRCASVDEIRAAAAELRHPTATVCVKPATAKGSRGFRIFCSPQERAHAILQGRPDDPRLTLDEFCQAIDAMGEPPEVLVMEFVEGIEHTVDVYCESGDVLIGFVKTREGMRNGLAMRFEIADQPALWQAALAIVDTFDCNFFLNIQFKGDKLLEVNPRVSTFVWDHHFNMPLVGLLHAAGRLTSDQVRRMPRPRLGTTALRFYDQRHTNESPQHYQVPSAGN